MSTTTVTSTELDSVLDDYKIHLSGYDSTPSSTVPSPYQDRHLQRETPPSSVSSSVSASPSSSFFAPRAPTSSTPPSNPAGWPTAHYRIPPYRPINHNLDYDERPLGSGAFEHGFLTMMFTGVVLNATSAKVWGRTLGPLFPDLFRYQIGGQW